MSGHRFFYAHVDSRSVQKMLIHMLTVCLVNVHVESQYRKHSSIKNTHCVVQNHILHNQLFTVQKMFMHMMTVHGSENVNTHVDSDSENVNC